MVNGKWLPDSIERLKASAWHQLYLPLLPFTHACELWTYLLPFSRYWRLKTENGLFSHPSLVLRPLAAERPVIST